MRRLNVKREEGVAMTEFALILPAFLLLVLGLIAFGNIFFYWIQTNQVASETARWAAVDRNPYVATEGSLQQHAAGSTSQQFSSDPARACIVFPDGNKNVGSRLQVKIEKPYGLRLRLPLLPDLNMGVTIRGSSTKRIERWAGAGATGPTQYDDGSSTAPFGTFSAANCPELP